MSGESSRNTSVCSSIGSSEDIKPSTNNNNNNTDTTHGNAEHHSSHSRSSSRSSGGDSEPSYKQHHHQGKLKASAAHKHSLKASAPYIKSEPNHNRHATAAASCNKSSSFLINDILSPAEQQSQKACQFGVCHKIFFLYINIYDY